MALPVSISELNCYDTLWLNWGRAWKMVAKCSLTICERFYMKKDQNLKWIKWWFLPIAVVGLCIFTAPCNALEPHEILVVANKNAARSVGLSKYYMKKRNIPQTNLAELWITDKEWCSRKDYEETNQKIAR